MNKILLAGALALAAASQAFAADEGAKQIVSLAGVDLNDRKDVHDFYSRLTRASSQACDSEAADWRVKIADRLCAQRAVAKAVEMLDRPVLTAMYDSRTGEPRRLASR